jgi:hypothetical protein
VALGVLAGGGLSRLAQSGSWLVTMYGIVEAAYLLGEVAVAAEAYQLLRPYAALPMTAGPAVACFGSVEHALGVAQLTVGDPVVAVEHLHAAVAHNTALGHWPATVLARHRLATALAGTGLSEHRAQARHEAQTAARDADQLGMRLPPAPTPPHPTPSPAPPSQTEPSPPVPVLASPGARPVASCRRHGRHWQVQAAGRRVLVASCRGMSYLAVLLANPGHEISALELATGPHPTNTTTTETALTSGASLTQPLLDEQAIRQYRRRIREVEQEIQRCVADGDHESATRMRAERDWLQAQLRAALGLGGRVQSFPTAEQRARVAVGKAIRRALARIAAADTELGAVLSATIHTGWYCVYRPQASHDTDAPTV